MRYGTFTIAGRYHYAQEQIVGVIEQAAFDAMAWKLYRTESKRGEDGPIHGGKFWAPNDYHATGVIRWWARIGKHMGNLDPQHRWYYRFAGKTQWIEWQEGEGDPMDEPDAVASLPPRASHTGREGEWGLHGDYTLFPYGTGRAFERVERIAARTEHYHLAGEMGTSLGNIVQGLEEEGSEFPLYVIVGLDESDAETPYLKVKTQNFETANIVLQALMTMHRLWCDCGRPSSPSGHHAIMTLPDALPTKKVFVARPEQGLECPDCRGPLEEMSPGNQDTTGMTYSCVACGKLTNGAEHG